VFEGNLTPILTGIASGLGGIIGATFWFRRWVKQTDDNIKELTKVVQELRVSTAIVTESKDKLDGRISQLSELVRNVSECIGKVKGNLDAVWKVLEQNKLSKRRLSDKRNEE
jgi:ABC-type transporter Mla subunit MlaD